MSFLPAIRKREQGGMTPAELAELHSEFVAPTEKIVNEIIHCAEEWSCAPDPWISADEHRTQRKLWWERNQYLLSKWRHLEQSLTHPDGKDELRLDDLTLGLVRWMGREYKILPEEWKNPDVTFKEFSGTDTKLQLWFYVDNVRLERYGRGRRVVTEIAQEVRDYIIALIAASNDDLA